MDGLTRNKATALPRMKPAITSEQWFRYSDTRFSPVRKAAHRVPRHSTGLASLLLFVLIVLVMYICKKGQAKNKKGLHQKCIFPTGTNPKSARMWQTPWFIEKKRHWEREEEVSSNSENIFRRTKPILLNDVKYPLAFTYWTFSEQVCTGSALLILCKYWLEWWQTCSECTWLSVCKGSQEFLLVLLQKL